MIVREATQADVPQICTFLRELTAAGKRTRPDDETFVSESYVGGPDNVSCAVAEIDGEVMGIQVLFVAQSGNQWDVPAGWGGVGTHVSPRAARKGVGKALFNATRQAAEKAGLVHIDASIGKDNTEGLGYYEAMGFRTYRTTDRLICKKFDV